MDLEARARTTQKCSEKSRQSEKETPRTSKALTRARPGIGGGMDGKSAGVPLTIISRDFDTLRVKLLSEAHREMPSSSTCTVWEWLAGTTRSVSSAYFSNRLMIFWGCRSEASITKEQGPRTEPCTMLAEMKAIAERMPLNLVWWHQSDRKLTTQLYTSTLAMEIIYNGALYK